MTTNLLQVVSPLKETAAACGNVLRGIVLVAGKEYTVEASIDKSVISIIDPETSLQDSFVWDVESATYLPDSLNGVTDAWSEQAVEAIDTIAQ
jgi:hypothetical protein